MLYNGAVLAIAERGFELLEGAEFCCGGSFRNEDQGHDQLLGSKSSSLLLKQQTKISKTLLKVPAHLMLYLSLLILLELLTALLCVL